MKHFLSSFPKLCSSQASPLKSPGIFQPTLGEPVSTTLPQWETAGILSQLQCGSLKNILSTFVSDYSKKFVILLDLYRTLGHLTFLLWPSRTQNWQKVWGKPTRPILLHSRDSLPNNIIQVPNLLSYLQRLSLTLTEQWIYYRVLVCILFLKVPCLSHHPWWLCWAKYAHSDALNHINMAIICTICSSG